MLDYQIPDELWEKIEPLILPQKPKKKFGRSRKDDRNMMTGIFYILCTGCQWKALPRSLGASSTVHDRFQEWQEAGLFEKMWRAGLLEYDKNKGIEWDWLGLAIHRWSHDKSSSERRGNWCKPNR